MKRIHELLEKRWFAYTFSMCSAVILYIVLTHLVDIGKTLGYIYGFLRPIVLGLVIAYILNPLVKLYERTVFSGIGKIVIRRSASLVLTMASVIVVMVVLLIALVPQLVDSISTLIGNLDSYAMSLQELLDRLNEAIPMIDISQIAERGSEFVESIPERLPQEASRIFSTTFSIGASMFTFIIGIFLAIYFLADKVRLQEGFKRLMRAIMSRQRYEDSSKFWSRCNTILLRYIGGDLLDGLLVGVINFVFMILMDMNYAVLISVVVGVTNLAPTFGPIFGAVIGAFILVLVNPWHALWFLVFTVILQTLDGYVIKPKLFGDTLGVPSVWILISIIVFGRMFGVIGIMLAIPFAAIIVYCYDEIIIHKLEGRKNGK